MGIRVDTRSAQERLQTLLALYDTQFGSVMYEAERAMLAQHLPNYFGYYLLQLGGPITLNWLEKSPVRHYCRFSDLSPLNYTKADCYGDFYSLPFANDSASVILLPHTLELMAKPEQLLVECSRTLMPEGVVVILLFNPWRILHCQSKFRKSVQNLNWHSFAKIRRLLAANAFDVEITRSFFHRPYSQQTKVLQKLRFMETLGQTLWPWMGNISLIIARKKVHTMTPIVKNSAKRRLMIEPNIAPSTRILHEKNYDSY